MSNSFDLDLSKIPNEDQPKLASAIETFYKGDTIQKSHLSYGWELNHLMLDGNQWLVYQGRSETGGIWERLKPLPENEYIPRPVTNYLFDVFQTLKSFLLKNRIRSTVRPNTQTNRDKTAAKIAELCIETNFERLQESYNYETAAACLLTYGTVFKKDYWDSSYLNTVKVPRMEQKPVTDPATGVVSGMEEVQAIDPTTGEPLFDILPLGDVFTAVVEPYRLAIDPLASNLFDARWVMEYSIKPLNWIIENYDKKEPGYTGRAQEVKAEKVLSNSLRRFYQLRTSSGVRGGGSGGTNTVTGGSEMVENCAVVKECYIAPTANYPKGRLIVVANNIVLYAEKSPYEGPDQGDWHPYSEARWEIVPGRFWGKGPMDAAVDIQRQINSIDSVIILTRKTMAVPQKLVPQGALPTGQWTGRPGQEHHYRPGPNGEKPELIPAVGVDSQVFKEREQRLEDLKSVTGAVDILKGDRPPGVTAASALNMLFEVGTGKLAPILERWRKFIEGSQKKQLRLIAQRYREPREYFIRALMSKNKELTEDQVKSFVGEDLYDNCNVVIEASSSIPKLKSAEHALLQENAQLGVLNLENPANRREYLSRQGIEGFDSDYSKDVKRAEWENDLLDSLVNSPDNHPVTLEVDNHDIHIQCHSDRMKEPSFMSLPIEVQRSFLTHIEEHRSMQMEAQQQQLMQAAMMGMPPNPPAPNPMQGPHENIRKGDGPPPEAKQLMMADLEGPASGVTE